MNTIVVGVDGSEPSTRALKLAVELAKSTDSPLHLVYALVPPVLPMDGNSFGIAELLAGHRQWGDGLLRELEKTLPAGVRVDDTVRDGNPAEVINAVASQLDAALIVVGNTGRGAMGRVLVGSTADRLVHTATRPVLVVR